jgi:hypothetical protein
VQFIKAAGSKELAGRPHWVAWMNPDCVLRIFARVGAPSFIAPGWSRRDCRHTLNLPAFDPTD